MNNKKVIFNLDNDSLIFNAIDWFENDETNENIDNEISSDENSSDEN